MSNKKQVISLFLLFFSFYLRGSKLISGNATVPGETFAFNIGQALLSQINNFYIAASVVQGEASQINSFSIARLMQGADKFTPLAPEQVAIEKMIDQPNPLFNQPIVAFALFNVDNGWLDMRDFPVVVSEKEPFNIYLIDAPFGTNKVGLAVAPNINDAAGFRTSGIIGLATDTDHVYAAVKPAEGLFGDVNSGIAVALKGVTQASENGEGQAGSFFQQIDAATGRINIPNDNTPFIPQAVKLDKTSPVVAIGADLAAMQNVVSLVWSSSMQRLFIGLQVTAQDGARAVVIGKLVDGGLQLHSIAPRTAFAPGNQNSIVGVSGTGLSVSANIVKTMYTSTALQYLIVAGGNQSSDVPTQAVHALPLVNFGEQTGSIANKNAQPKNIFASEMPFNFISRIITQPAEVPEDMPQANEPAVTVGGGAFTAGIITDMVVRNDTVFIFVGQERIEDAAGIYYSQALFEPSGKIKGWTDWQRTSGITDQTVFGVLNSSTGSFITAIGQNDQSVNVVKKTIWSEGDPQGLKPVTDIVQTALTPQTGGTQSLYTFLPTTPGLSNISLLAFGGSGTLVLAQTGISNTVLIPTNAADYFPTQVFENGTITHDPTGSKSVVITGGALNDVGPITAIEIGQTQNNGWIFVGGIDGVAVLANPDGSGWNSLSGQLGNNFNGLVTGMRFVKIGNYSFVKKLIADEQFLYVVTDTLVDRIDLIASDFSMNDIKAVSVATQQGLVEVTETGGIVDAIMSGPLGIIATTGGLLRVGDGKAINSASTETELEWTFVPIPEAAGAPVLLRTATKTGRAQDIAGTIGGQIYVLNSSNGFNQSRINRFAVKPVVGNTVESDTLERFDDVYVKNIPSFFLSFGQFKNIFTTNGALYFASRGAINNQIATVTLTPSIPEPRVGVAQVGERSVVQDIIFNNETQLNAFEASQGSGSWIVAGNRGMDVFE